MLDFQAIEVNASDNGGKADAKIEKGIGGSNANSIKELVSNEAFSVNMDRSKHPKTVLIMDEVDGMSAGDRGGVADLIASIKISKIPIICIYGKEANVILSGAKDEDISPFTAVDKLFGFNAGKLRMDERIDLSMSEKCINDFLF
ncbi:hypothetical protein CMV_019035 [Castanea mollissima]|uniref:Uncharacterized protein n=1 Tax=Castanea mollissima TaxID=60419 RepID=A0A8J4QZ29_9ROSI|nr:hypothetical protein CMV_019035 [Castanea mollissima]